MARYIVGWNMPGYLPESEPAEFDDFYDATQYLIATLDDITECNS